MTISPLRAFERGPNFFGEVKRKINELISEVNSGGGGGGSSIWGGITGVLSNQSDLQSALNAKANASAVAVNQATLDFGTFAYDAVVSVADASVTGSTKVMSSLTIGSGRDADELEMAPITIAHVVKSGVGIDIYAHALQGANGQYIVNYTKV